VKGAAAWDRKMSEARKRLDWPAQAKLSIDPERAQRVHAKHSASSSACSMCGDFCAMDFVEKYLGVTAPKC
jgi:phosphomethylpyrimidine synthase